MVEMLALGTTALKKGKEGRGGGGRKGTKPSEISYTRKVAVRTSVIYI